jgi:hypothetical protein
MRITSSGNVGIGTTSPYARLSVWGPDSASSTLALNVVNSASTTVLAVFDGGNAELSGTLTQSSDQRLKTNIQTLDASSSLAEIEALNPVSFNWINDIFGSGGQLGFIAQQVQGIFPQLVSTTSPTIFTPGGTLGLNYTGLIAPMVGAIQALAAEVSTLEQTVSGFAESFTSHKVTTDQLCVGSTCIDQQQLAALLAQAGQGSAGAPAISTPTASSSPAGEPPQIQVNGANPAQIQVGDTYVDLGAKITAPTADLNLGIAARLDAAATTTPDKITIDTTKPATHTILYCATDQAGETGCASRIVNVAGGVPRCTI